MHCGVGVDLEEAVFPTEVLCDAGQGDGVGGLLRVGVVNAERDIGHVPAKVEVHGAEGRCVAHIFGIHPQRNKAWAVGAVWVRGGGSARRAVARGRGAQRAATSAEHDGVAKEAIAEHSVRVLQSRRARGRREKIESLDEWMRRPCAVGV